MKPGVIIPFVLLFIVVVHGQWPYNPYKRTYGAIWPLPQEIQTSSKVWSINPESFKIVSDYQCDITTDAINRYIKRLFPIAHERLSHPTENVLEALYIIVQIICPIDFPSLKMDESYKLDVTRKTAVLKANEVWGALRGLESFSHMVYYNKTSGYQIRAEIVKDFPRFPHRGVLLDTARHFLSVNALKGNIDLMAQNKFNVFHWHMTDTESCPYSSRVLPKLDHGAYDDKHKYTIEEITDVIAYARLRGVRVIPEFDSPAHAGSWGKGYPNVLAKCFAEGSADSYEGGIVDPTNNETWDFLETLFQEVYKVFPDQFIHIGGDEANYWFEPCWENNKNISDFMKVSHICMPYFVQQIVKNETDLRFNQTDSKKEISLSCSLCDSIVHVWQGNSYYEMMEYMYRVTAAGKFAILSSCWYMDYSYGLNDWVLFYQCDPQGFAGSETQKALVLGGAAILWGEWVDETNMFPRLWPRTSAVAERLWSSPNLTKFPNDAWPRMVSRGYPVQPSYGPGFCDLEYRAKLPI
ncbi:unnamed protein product [Dracunculus medinensis]|uniref:Beta-hexosaminidase n=1 Tax=Dracunculus medinensis TaxID=318479 RepID=A0A0N4U6D7_DRAME|nr:unnamed protein product [Dracunculus medinensis]